MLLKRALTLLKEEDGQSMVEYGIILALISVVAIGMVQAVGKRVDGAFTKVNTELTGAGIGDAAPPANPPADGG